MDIVSLLAKVGKCITNCKNILLSKCEYGSNVKTNKPNDANMCHTQ